MGLKSGFAVHHCQLRGRRDGTTALTTPDVLTINRLLSKMVQSVVPIALWKSVLMP